MIGLLKSEWIKLTTVRSPYWLYTLGVLFTVGIGAIIGRVSSSDGGGDAGDGGPSLLALFAMLGVGVFLQSFVWIQSIIAVTGDFRYNTNKTTYLAAPRRWDAVLAKTLVVVLATVVVSAVGVLLGLLAGRLFGAEDWSPFADDGLRYLLRFPVFFGIGALACIGLAYTLRNAAGAISLVLVWTLAAEDMLPQVPKVGEKIAGWLPFANGRYWTQGELARGLIDWGQPAALAWYAAICLVIWGIGVAMVLRRDA